MQQKEILAEDVKNILRTSFKNYSWFKGAGISFMNNDISVIVKSSKITDLIPNSINGVKIQTIYV